MMNRTRRGAARVSITWMIVVMIAFFASLSMVFVFDGELEETKKLVTEAEVARDAAVAQLETELVYSRGVSTKLGYYDREAAAARTVIATAEEGITSFKDAFNNNEGSVVDMETMAKRAGEERSRLVTEIRDMKAKVSSLEADINVRMGNLSSMTADKDGQIRTLQQQINDANQAAADRQNELEGEISSVRQALADAERVSAGAKNDTVAALQSKADREAELTTRLENVTAKLEWAREPERPDGRILEVSEALGLAYINLGKANRLYGGMRFSIVDGRTGDDTVKAYCEVLNVMDGMSECKIVEVRDPFDPPTAGDIIFNPLYDPTGLRNAILVGRFSGTYNENEIRALLEGININVQGKLDKTTDYLVVGAELYTDENGEPLEEPLQPSELPVFKEAQAKGVRIVPLKLVTDYFRKSSN
jgi:hypothetical protein